MFRSTGTRSFSITSHSLCRECNENFGEEFCLVHSRIESFLSGVTRLIEPNEILGVQRFFQRIGFIVDYETALFDPNIMISSDADIKFNEFNHRNPPIYSLRDRKLFLDNKPTRLPSVWFARFTGEYADAQPIKIHKVQSHEYFGKKLIFIIGRIAACISIGEAAIPKSKKFQELRYIDDMHRFQLRDRSRVNDKDFLGELAQDAETAVRRYELSTRSGRKAYRATQKKHGVKLFGNSYFPKDPRL